MTELTWRVLSILIIGGSLYFIIRRFGKRAIRLALIKERMVLGGRPTALSHYDQQRIETLSSVFSHLVRFSIIAVVVVWLLSELGVAVGALLAGAGVVGVAIGFGAQNLMKDILNGFFIIIERQYVKGDQVKLGEVEGEVVHLSLRSTILRDTAAIFYYIPNGSIPFVINYSKGQTKHPA